ncbi:hypothetical protein I4F81_007986 [Pyropia yezoensis]|uniref:Uncharacterized protein n=1 Tax=Pyropia yezoensis TaxID=2788 RepID=A0ACC3C5H6_PYRYE|nr:hypothetical protein I4F81_007986 [Neopyropia yezoensis]
MEAAERLFATVLQREGDRPWMDAALACALVDAGVPTCSIWDLWTLVLAQAESGKTRRLLHGEPHAEPPVVAVVAWAHDILGDLGDWVREIAAGALAALRARAAAAREDPDAACTTDRQAAVGYHVGIYLVVRVPGPGIYGEQVVRCMPATTGIFKRIHELCCCQAHFGFDKLLQEEEARQARTWRCVPALDCSGDALGIAQLSAVAYALEDVLYNARAPLSDLKNAVRPRMRTALQASSAVRAHWVDLCGALERFLLMFGDVIVPVLYHDEAFGPSRSFGAAVNRLRTSPSHFLQDEAEEFKLNAWRLDWRLSLAAGVERLAHQRQRGIAAEAIAFVREHKRAPSRRAASSREEVALYCRLFRDKANLPPISEWGLKKLDAAWMEATGAPSFPLHIVWYRGVRPERAAE